MFSHRLWWEKVFLDSKVQVFNISGDGFLKTKNQRPSQVKNNGDILEDLSNISCHFFPPFFHFLELYDDITRFNTENAFNIV